MRSSERRMHTSDSTRGPRVGGRQAGSRLAAGGGGYPDSCSATALGLRPEIGAGAPDPRFADLESAGISPGWLRIAHLIGVDAYLALAGLFITESPKALDEHRVNLPTLVRYLRTAAAPYQYAFWGASAPRTDPRLTDLRDAGVLRIWRQMAEVIGTDRWFVAVGIAITSDARTAVEPRICAPAALTLYRIGRDAQIRSLHARGHSAREIREWVRRSLGETLTKMRIYQVIGHA